MREITTANIGEFGWEERRAAVELMTALCDQGFPDDFEQTGVHLMFNRNSGAVFFANDEYQACMMCDSVLESYYTTPCGGHEGFEHEIREQFQGWGTSWDFEDVEYIHNLGIISDEEYDEWMEVA